MSITPEQCRAARGLLGWSQNELAERANTGYSTVADFERGARIPIANNLAAIRAALEGGGVIFIPGNGEGPGVRLSKTAIEVPANPATVVRPARASRDGGAKRPSKLRRARRRR
jgi:transcriptional regulator with XRE-family HTH domain